MQFLGTAGYHPNETRQTVCAFLPEFGIVLDAGTGAFRLRGQINLPRLDIFLSHLHLDHSAGVTYLLNVLWGTSVSARFWGLPAHLGALREKLFGGELFPLEFGGEACPYKTEDAPTTKWVGLLKEGVTETFSVTAKELPHPGGSVGYRFVFPNSKVLVYVTDTTCSPDYLDFVRGADILIHECNFPDTIPGMKQWSGKELAEKTSHSWASGVAELALSAQVKQLVLTHLNPLDPSIDPTHQDESAARHPNTVIAKDGMILKF